MNHPKEFAEGLSIGIIMDGNGRWAKQRGLPRTAGHKKGAAVFQDIANYCEELGVSSVYFYAFSTENWKRPLEEVSAIMKLFGEYLLKGFNYKDRNIRIKFLGDLATFDLTCRQCMEYGIYSYSKFEAILRRNGMNASHLTLRTFHFT